MKYLIIIILAGAGYYFYSNQSTSNMTAASYEALTTTAPHANTAEIFNPNLIAAINKIGSEKTLEARSNLYKELNKAKYLVPLLKNTTGSADYSAYIINDPKHGKYQAIYTDHKQMLKSNIEPEKIIELNAQDVWSMALVTTNIDGVVLNPNDNALPLNKKRILEIQKY